MRPLDTPPAAERDEDATEMIRVWLADDDVHVSLLLGMWQDEPELELDERDAWGELLGNVVHHIAHGLEQSHGWDRQETTKRIRNAMLEAMAEKADVDGGFSDA